MHTLIYRREVDRGSGDPPLIVTADDYPFAPIEVGLHGDSHTLTITAAKKLRKKLKRAIEVAESHHGKGSS